MSRGNCRVTVTPSPSSSHSPLVSAACRRFIRNFTRSFNLEFFPPVFFFFSLSFPPPFCFVLFCFVSEFTSNSAESLRNDYCYSTSSGYDTFSRILEDLLIVRTRVWCQLPKMSSSISHKTVLRTTFFSYRKTFRLTKYISLSSSPNAARFYDGFFLGRIKFITLKLNY